MRVTLVVLAGLLGGLGGGFLVHALSRGEPGVRAAAPAPKTASDQAARQRWADLEERVEALEARAAPAAPDRPRPRVVPAPEPGRPAE
ncbi:MAG: hypothetical protein ACE5JG_13480, partial [Planctomycetota bacterium]